MSKPRLYKIQVLVESDDRQVIDDLQENIERLICPHLVTDHPDRCPRRWFILTSRLRGKRAAKWEDLLNE